MAPPKEKRKPDQHHVNKLKASHRKGRYIMVPANGEGAQLESQLTSYFTGDPDRHPEQGVDNSNSILSTSGNRRVALTSMSRDKFSYVTEQSWKPEYVCAGSPTTFGHRCAGSEIVLINREHAPQSFNGKAYSHHGIEVIADSGGFQLGRGISSFIPPEELAEFYENHATMGMGLDLPIHPDLQDEFLMRAAVLQKHLNKRLRKLAPNTPLFTVSHGTTVERRDKFMEKVFDPKVKKLALGGVGTMRTSVKAHQVPLATQAVMHMFHKYGNHYEHIHLLGTTSPYWMLVYQLMVLLGNVPLITSDSVTHLKAAVSGGYIVSTGFGLSSRIIISHRMPGFGPMAALCGCPSCIVMGQDYKNFSVTPRVLAMHNLHALHAQARTMRNAAEAFIDGHSFNTLFEYLGTKAKVAEWQRVFAPSIAYVLDTFEKGIKNAKFTNADVATNMSGTSLMTSFKTSKPKLNPERFARYTKVLDNYSKYLGVKV